MKFFPESALVQLEFDKIKQLVEAHCKTEYALAKVADLRIHTRKDYIDLDLRQTNEYKIILESGNYFPNDHALNISKELKLLSIPGAVLSGEQFVLIRKLAESLKNIFRWFDNDTRTAFPALVKVIKNTYYEKAILEMLNDILEDNGTVKDSASEELQQIRMSLYRKRNELRKVFEKVVSKWTKAGYVADIEESFLNGRRVVAVQAEYKRQVKGILLGESDTRKTSFVEPEETIELNNDVFELENEERREVYRILRQLTQHLSVYASLLKTYLDILGEYDFIRAKAKFAVEIKGQVPQLTDKAQTHLIQAFHPLLYLYNQKAGKTTYPTQIHLDDKNRILLISGPNAGGKTVTLKTVGLLQLMLQSGLLIPVHPSSEMGIYKQIMIHIGDTQSLEFELSTYSSHLKNMKHFVEFSNGRTLFFIDELGSGSDPNLGGAFAEVIMEELVKKHAQGIVTTHYLNLKVMAGKTPGIINGAMAFDETNLMPLYKLNIGKPGSSYTFSIAERIGLDKRLIERARQLVDNDHFRLDKLLTRTEQDLQFLEKKEKELNKLMRENERLKKEMEQTLDKEKHRQQVELLRQQNRITEDRIQYLKDMERKLKQIVMDWKKATGEDKKEFMKQLQILLFKQNQQQSTEKAQKKVNTKFQEVKADLVIGQQVLIKKNHQVGVIKELKGKKAIVQVGLMPITVDAGELVAVMKKEEGSN